MLQLGLNPLDEAACIHWVCHARGPSHSSTTPWTLRPGHATGHATGHSFTAPSPGVRHAAIRQCFAGMARLKGLRCLSSACDFQCKHLGRGGRSNLISANLVSWCHSPGKQHSAVGSPLASSMTVQSTTSVSNPLELCEKAASQSSFWKCINGHDMT